MKKRMIFYIPADWRPGERPSASQIRPGKMLQAFQELGYEVTLVTGTAKQRSQKNQEILQEMSEGARFDFCYIESSTMPTLLTESHHLPLRPWVDFGFWWRLKRAGIPMGLFYRDIYWKFSDYWRENNALKAAVASLFYVLDLLLFRFILNRIYLPSMHMAPLLGRALSKVCRPLPPGTDVVEVNPPLHQSERLSLLYVGGLGSHYDLKDSLSQILELPFTDVALCCRSNEWGTSDLRELQTRYGRRLQVHHRSGHELRELYHTAQICLLSFSPSPYRKFAFPFKLMEYLSYKRPVLAVDGTEASDFIKREKIGWVVKDTATDLQRTLTAIHQDRDELKRFGDFSEQISRNTWLSRAAQVQSDLMGLVQRRS